MSILLFLGAGVGVSGSADHDLLGAVGIGYARRAAGACMVDRCGICDW